MPAVVDWSSFARARDDGLLQMSLAVDGIVCGGCIGRIEGELKRLPGVTEARLNYTNRRLTIAWRQGLLEPATVTSALARLGYNAHPFQARAAERDESEQAQWLLRCLGVAGFAAMNIMLLSVSVWSGNASDITPETRDFFHWASALIAVPAVAYAGQPFFRSAWAALRARSVNMDVPISLGVLLAIGMSLVETANHAPHAYYDSAVMLLFFLLCGRALDVILRRRTRATAGNLAALKAEMAHRLCDDGQLVEVPASALAAGDRVVVRPGDRVPADGVVLVGSSGLDEGLISGETAPRGVQEGATVYAGSINLTGALTVRVTAGGANTLIDDIERLLDRAAQAKSHYVRLADRAARAYAPVVHATAALTFAGWWIAGATVHDAIITAIAVLIITCPCALALAIPAVQMVAAGKLFRSGVLLNAGDAVERLAEADTVVFDKTGTLTLPEGHVTNADMIDPELLQRAARLALSSRHPLAAAIARRATDRTPYERAVEEPGRGVRAVVDGRELRLGSMEFCGVDERAWISDNAVGRASTLAVSDGKRSAVLTIQQSLRSDAVPIVATLNAMGIDVHILSGDRAEAVEPIAGALGVGRWQASLKPADKVAVLEALRESGRRVLMVGDGLNDAPALASGYVSMSPITAADVSQAHSDAVFLGERLAPVLTAIEISRRARNMMRQNLWLAVVYNAVAVPLAIAGGVTPLIAAAAMSGSSILVTLNALRLAKLPSLSSGPAVTGRRSAANLRSNLA
jgi:Cu2+-exporting ATPase